MASDYESLEAKLDPKSLNFEDFYLKSAQCQSVRMSNETKVPPPEPHKFIKREPQWYHIQKVPYVTFLRALRTTSYEILIFGANESATKITAQFKVLNPKCFLKSASFAQEVLLTKHLTAYNKRCWIVPNNFRCILPNGLERIDIPYSKKIREEASFWVVPVFDGKVRQTCTSLILVRYEDWALWDDTYGPDGRSSNKYSASDAIMESHVGEKAYLSGTNELSRLKINYNKYRDDDFFGTGNFNGQILNVIFDRRISKMNIHSHPAMLGHLNSARKAGQSFIVISNLPAKYSLRTSNDRGNFTSLIMDDHPQFLQMVNAKNVALAIIKKDIHYKRYYVKTKKEEDIGPAKFDTVMIYVGFKRDIVQILGHGEVKWEDFSFLSDLKPINPSLIFPRLSRSKLLLAHLQMELDVSRAENVKIRPSPPSSLLLKICNSNMKRYKILDTRLHLLRNRLLPILKKLAKKFKSYRRPLISYSKSEYAKITREDEKRMKSFSRDLACSTCNRRGHDTLSCWTIFKLPTTLTPQLSVLIRVIDSFNVRKLPCFAKPGHVARLQEWIQFENVFYEERARFILFAKEKFGVDPDDKEIHGGVSGFGLNRRNWVTLLLFNTHKTLVKRAMVGFRPYWLTSDKSLPILPTPVIFINKTETKDDAECYAETVKDSGLGKYLPVPFDPKQNSLIRGGAKVFRVHEDQPDGTVKERGITAGTVSNAALFQLKKTLPNERKVGRFTRKGAQYVTCDASSCFEQIPARMEYGCYFAHVFQLKDGSFRAFLPTGNAQGGRQSPPNASEIVNAFTDGVSAAGLDGISYVDDLNFRVSDGTHNIDTERGPETQIEIDQKCERLRIFMEKNCLVMNPQKHSKPGLSFKMIGYIWDVNNGSRVPVPKRVAKFTKEFGTLIDESTTTLGNLNTATGMFVNLYAHHETTTLLTDALYKLITSVYGLHNLQFSTRLCDKERNLPVVVPQTLKDSLVDFVLTHKFVSEFRKTDLAATVNPITCPPDGKIVDPTNTSILVTDAGRGALGCIAIVSKDGQFHFIKKYPEVLRKVDKEKHSTKREIMAGLHYLKILRPTIVANKTKILNWLTDSTASTCILAGIFRHDDPEVMKLLTDLRATCMHLGVKINIVWRRRNFPLLQFADLMTKLVPSQGDETSSEFRRITKKFLHGLSRKYPKLKKPLCKRIFSVLGSGKLLEATKGPSNILVFPFSSTICDDIFLTVHELPRNKLLIIPVFPSSEIWKFLTTSSLKMRWIGLATELFPSTPIRCKVSVWY